MSEQPAERPACPAAGCQGKLETVTSTCRPGEIDVSVRCDGCGRVKHVTLDDHGHPFDEAALRAHRGGHAEPPAEA